MMMPDRRLICCVDDEESAPKYLMEHVERLPEDRRHGIHVFWLRVARREETSHHEATDVVDALKRGDTPQSAPMGIMAVMEVVCSLCKDTSSWKNVLFICDLSFDLSEDELGKIQKLDQDYQALFNNKILSPNIWQQAPYATAGGAVAAKVARAAVPYIILSNRAADGDFEVDVFAKKPLLNRRIGDVQESVESLMGVVKQEFGIAETWSSLARNRPAVLQSVRKQYSKELVLVGTVGMTHDVHNVFELEQHDVIGNVARCAKVRLEELGLVQADVSDALVCLKKDDRNHMSKRFGIAKTKAILYRVESRIYLFDLLHFLWHSGQRDIWIDRDMCASDILCNLCVEGLTFANVEKEAADVGELLDFLCKVDFKWRHCVTTTNPARVVYRLSVRPEKWDGRRIDLVSFIGGRRNDGSFSQVRDAVCWLFKGDPQAQEVDNDIDAAMGSVVGDGVHLIVRKGLTGDEVGLVGIKTFGCGARQVVQVVQP